MDWYIVKVEPRDLDFFNHTSPRLVVAEQITRWRWDNNNSSESLRMEVLRQYIYNVSTDGENDSNHILVRAHPDMEWICDPKHFDVDRDEISSRDMDIYSSVDRPIYAIVGVHEGLYVGHMYIWSEGEKMFCIGLRKASWSVYPKFLDAIIDVATKYFGRIHIVSPLVHVLFRLHRLGWRSQTLETGVMGEMCCYTLK